MMEITNFAIQFPSRVLLDDIQKQISADMSLNGDGNETYFVKPPPFRRIDGDSTSDIGDIEEGVVRGFAIQHATPSGFVLPNNHSNHLQNDFDGEYYQQNVAGNKAGFDHCYLFNSCHQS